MAKLNGVKTVSKRIEYAGVTYEVSKDAAVKGDIVRLDDVSSEYLTDGGYYVVDSVDEYDDAQITDDDGDDYDTGGLDLTVFKAVESATTPQEPEASEVSDVKAKIGDTIRITNAWGTMERYKDGDVFVVTNVRDDGRVFVAEHGRPIAQDEYDVVTPALPDKLPEEYASDLPSRLPQEYAIHDGKIYVKEARKAEKGELVIVVNDQKTHWWKNGDVFTVENTQFPYAAVGLNNGDNVLEGGYNVLTPVTSVTLNGKAYALESRKAAKGETVLITHANGPHFTKGKAYTIASMIGDNPLVKADNDGHDTVIHDSKYVVLTPITAKPAPSSTRLSVGDYAKLTEKYEGSGQPGDIVKITCDYGDLPYPFRIAKVGGGYDGILAGLSEVTRATDAEVAGAKRKLEPQTTYQAGDVVRDKRGKYTWETTLIERRPSLDDAGYGKAWKHTHDNGWIGEDQLTLVKRAEPKPQVSIGDSVRIINGGGPCLHGFDNGCIATVTGLTPSRSYGFQVKNADTAGYANAEDFEVLTPAEAEAYVKQAEMAAAERKEAEKREAESAKWARIGRKVNEYKVGDVVRVTNASGSSLKNGDIGEVSEMDCDEVPIRVNTETVNSENWQRISDVELVTPVESRFDRGN